MSMTYNKGGFMDIRYIKKRLLALGIDWLIMSVYIITLAGIALSIYYLFFGGIPEINQLTSQVIAALTTVIPICIFSTIYEMKSEYGSIGKKKMGLKVLKESTSIYRPFIRNIFKFLPWQLAHIAVISGIYTEFSSITFIVFYVISILLVVLYVVQVFFTKEHKHLPDIISKSKVIEI